MHFMPSQLSVCHTLTLGTHTICLILEREREREGGGVSQCLETRAIIMSVFVE